MDVRLFLDKSSVNNLFIPSIYGKNVNLFPDKFNVSNYDNYYSENTPILLFDKSNLFNFGVTNLGTSYN